MPPKRLMNDVMSILKDEKASLTDKLQRVEAAMKALAGEPLPKKTGRKAGWKMSAETKAKLSKMAKARWAKTKRITR
jgi:hypothetical protein